MKMYDCIPDHVKHNFRCNKRHRVALCGYRFKCSFEITIVHFWLYMIFLGVLLAFILKTLGCLYRRRMLTKLKEKGSLSSSLSTADLGIRSSCTPEGSVPTPLSTPDCGSDIPVECSAERPSLRAGSLNSGSLQIGNLPSGNLQSVCLPGGSFQAVGYPTGSIRPGNCIPGNSPPGFSSSGLPTGNFPPGGLQAGSVAQGSLQRLLNSGPSAGQPNNCDLTNCGCGCIPSNRLQPKLRCKTTNKTNVCKTPSNNSCNRCVSTDSFDSKMLKSFC